MGEKFKWPFPHSPYPLWWKWSSSFTLAAVGAISKFWLHFLNSTTVCKHENLVKAISNRPKKVPLITVSNHYSCIDDPIISGILPWKFLFNSQNLRWTPAAHDICFTKSWHGIFFGLGQTIPVVRGDGIHQRGMDYCLEKLNEGGWVHIFPEGRVNMDKSWIRLKWGVGRLIRESNVTPMVLPIFHLGLDDILPNEPPYIPQIGKKVTILVGEPINCQSVLEKSRRLKHSFEEQRKCLTDVIQTELDKLKKEALKIHFSS